MAICCFTICSLNKIKIIQAKIAIVRILCMVCPFILSSFFFKSICISIYILYFYPAMISYFIPTLTHLKQPIFIWCLFPPTLRRKLISKFRICRFFNDKRHAIFSSCYGNITSCFCLIFQSAIIVAK